MLRASLGAVLQPVGVLSTRRSRIRLPHSLAFVELNTVRILRTGLFPGSKDGAYMNETSGVGCAVRSCLVTVVDLELLVAAKHPVKVSLASLRGHVAW